jgi:C-terminal processing protease CtpA/Prc
MTISGVGVTPDQEIRLTDVELQQGQDPQLDAALEY